MEMSPIFFGSWSDKDGDFSFQIVKDINGEIYISCRHDSGWGGVGEVSNLTISNHDVIGFKMKFPLNEFFGLFILSGSEIKSVLRTRYNTSTKIDFYKK